MYLGIAMHFLSDSTVILEWTEMQNIPFRAEHCDSRKTFTLYGARPSTTEEQNFRGLFKPTASYLVSGDSALEEDNEIQ